MRISLLALSCLTLGMGLNNPAQADAGLVNLYAIAQQRDPQFLAARSALEVGQEEKAIGRAALLPQITANFGVMRFDYEMRTLAAPGLKSKYDYTNKSGGLQISQPLFEMERFATYEEGKAKAALAQAVFEEARQDLLLRLTQAYFNYFYAKDIHKLAQSQLDAANEQMRAAERLVQAGAGSVTDIEESRSRMALAQAQLAAAGSSIQVRRQELEKMVGQLPALRPLGAEPRLVLPEPPQPEKWLTAAGTQSPTVLRARMALDVVTRQEQRAQAGHWPTVNFVASRQKADEPNYYTLDDATTRWGVQMNIPIYEGGRTSALNRQASARRAQALHEVDAAREDSRIKASQAYLGVVNGVAQVAAYEQAVKSAEITRQGMEVGQQAGFRTNTDVLNAQQQYFAARRDLQRERYAYLVSRLQLQSVSGGAGEKDLAAIDALLDTGSSQ
ncbi:MAG: TolC family outer membrane protein [Sterolibacterium sp.]|nr:TolC family outer membrane protein [Sterolibacterium sp.]